MYGRSDWNIKGPKKWDSVINVIRNYVERRIPLCIEESKSIPTRPQKPVNLSLGDPAKYNNFKVNKNLLDILADGVDKFDGYTEFRGTQKARYAISKFFSDVYGCPINKDDVFMTFGGSLAIWLCIAVLCNPGDNFVMPEAGFPLANTIAHSLGVETKFYKLDRMNNWQCDFESMKYQVNEKTKFILVNDPSNPLGTVWSEQHKKDIIYFCRVHKLPLVADEIYETMTFTKQPAKFCTLRGDVTVLKCSGLTKKWLVPGWRMGWVIVYGGEETKLIRQGLLNLIDVILMPHSIIQGQMVQILEYPTHEYFLSEKMGLLNKNQQYLAYELKNYKYCIVSNVSGTLYSTITIRIEYFDMKDTEYFALKFFKEYNVMVFPGELFFSHNFLRLVICCDFEDIVEFVTRFKRFCQRHLKQ